MTLTISYRNVIWFMIIFILVFVVIGIFYYFNSPGSPSINPVSYQNEYLTAGFWSAASANDDSTRNTCKLYSFTGNIDSGSTLCNMNRSIPAQSTLNPTILDSIQPQNPGSCYDVDQIVAVKVNHTCITSESLQEGDFAGYNAEGVPGVSFCYDFDGSTVPIGTTTPFYAQTVTIFNESNQAISVNCGTLQCAGVLGVLGINYSTIDYNPSLHITQPVCLNNGGMTPTLRCLQSDGNGNFSSVECNLSEQGQLIRMVRAQPGSPFAVSDPTLGTSGPIAQLYSRIDGRYIVQDQNNPTKLTLGDPGPSWFLVNFTIGDITNAVQQIVYIGNLTTQQVSDMTKLTGQSLINAIQGYNLYSIQLSKTNPYSLILAPYSTYNPQNLPLPNNSIYYASTQHIPYTLYNTSLFTTYSLTWGL